MKNTNNNANINISDFPSELLLHIFSFLQISDLGKVASVSKFFNSVSSDERMWKYLAITYFPFAVEKKLSSQENKDQPISYKNIFGRAFVKQRKFIKENSFNEMHIAIYNTAKDDKLERLNKFKIKDCVHILQNETLCDEYGRHPFLYANRNKVNKGNKCSKFLDFFAPYLVADDNETKEWKPAERSIMELRAAILCSKIDEIVTLIDKVDYLSHLKNTDYFADKLKLDVEKSITPILISKAICIVGNIEIFSLILKNCSEEEQIKILSNMYYIALKLNALEIIKFAINTGKVNHMKDWALQQKFSRAEIYHCFAANRVYLKHAIESNNLKKFAMFLKEEPLSKIADYFFPVLAVGRMWHKKKDKLGVFCRDQECYEMLKSLLEIGRDVININTIFSNTDNLPILHYAIKLMDYDLIEILLLAGADINLKQSSDYLPGATALKFYKALYKESYPKNNNHQEKDENFIKKRFYCLAIGALLKSDLYLKKALESTQNYFNSKESVEKNLKKAKEINSEYYGRYIEKLINKENKDTKETALLTMYNKLFTGSSASLSRK